MSQEQRWPKEILEKLEKIERGIIDDTTDAVPPDYRAGKERPEKRKPAKGSSRKPRSARPGRSRVR